MTQTWMIVLAVVPLVVFDLLLVFVILPRWIGSMWIPLAQAFPPVAPEADAVRRNFQSFNIGLLNLGWSLHVAADSRHLHLYPTRMSRMFRLTPVSIPWDQMVPTKYGARVGPHVIRMPRWLRPLVRPDKAAS